MYAFQSCTTLTSLVIPASVTTIDWQAFLNCTSLQEVTFAGTTPPATISGNAFSQCNSITKIKVPAGSEEAYNTKLASVIPNWSTTVTVETYESPKQSSGSSSGSSSSRHHHHHSSGGGSTAAKTTTSADSSAAKSNSPFTDVSEADWFYPDVAFYNYAKYKGYDVSDTGAIDTYADGAAVSAWSRDAVNWAVGAGIINSRTDELFAPQAETMNAELAVMLHRFIEKYGLVPVPSATQDGTVIWIKLSDAE